MHAALATTWEALQYPGWSEPQYGATSDELGILYVAGSLRRQFSMERATQELEMREMRGFV